MKKNNNPEKIEALKREYESKIMSFLSEHTQHRLPKDKIFSFFNTISQYYSLVNGLDIESSRIVAPASEVERETPSKTSRKFTLGYCPKGSNKIAISKTFVNTLANRFVPSKQLLTAGVILVGHESTHNKQDIRAEQAVENPNNLTEAERRFFTDSGMEVMINNMQDAKQVIENINKMKSGKNSGFRKKLLMVLGSYTANTREVDARKGGIDFCRTLYENLLSNPEIQKFPEVQKWIEKQGGMIGLHEKIEGFLDKKIIKNYTRFVESCDASAEDLIKYALSEEMPDPDDGNNTTKGRTSIFFGTIKLAIKTKTLKELQEIKSKIDKSKTPMLDEIIEEAIVNYQKYSPTNQTSQEAQNNTSEEQQNNSPHVRPVTKKELAEAGYQGNKPYVPTKEQLEMEQREKERQKAMQSSSPVRANN